MNNAMTELIEHDGGQRAKAILEALIMHEAVDRRTQRGYRK